ncbi:hypothetical protein [Actinomadura sp. 3N508]|uniref:hypothetical protein n=1 Tax=Actinomadura sp. 3N508 TaxID=3375153 RepID=UPI0037A576FC
MSQPDDGAKSREPAEEQESGGAEEQQKPAEPSARQDEEAASGEGYPASEEEALRALGEGEDSGRPSQHAQYLDIIKQITERYAGDAAGPSIGTLALFQDTVEFGGDFNTGGAARRRRASSRIDLDRLGSYLTGFVEPPNFAPAVQVLRERRLLILALPPGTGREAAVYNLLDRLPNPGNGNTRPESMLLSETAPLDTPGWRPDIRHGAFVVDLDGAIDAHRQDGGLTADRIDERWIAETAAALRETHGYMIVLTGPARGALLEAAERSAHVVTMLGRVPPMQIIERRVLGADHDPVRRRELHAKLTACGAERLLHEYPEPRVAARIAEAVDTGLNLTTVVQELRDPTGEVHRRLSRYQDPEYVSFAVASAVLEGSGYLTVSDAALDLYAMLVPDEETPPLSRIRFRDRLGAEQNWIEVAVSPGEDGRPGTPQVRFRRPLLQQAVLEYAWTYLDSDRPAFVLWLRRLVTHSDVEVRARAAVAAGMLAGSDPAHALHRLVRPWALDGSPLLRQAAATTLDLLSTRPGLAGEIWTLLDSWAAEGGTGALPRRLALTAGAAAGQIMGSRDPDRAVSVLRAALDRDDWALLPTVAASLLQLIEFGRAREVLAALLEWSAAQDTSPLVTKTLSAFVFASTEPAPELRLAVRATADEPRRNRSRLGLPATDEDAAPLLLTHAAEHHAQLVALWARSLARNPVKTQALARLRSCMETHADRDPAVRTQMRELLVGVAAQPGQHRERLLYYLGLWADDRKRSNKTAAYIRATLLRGGTSRRHTTAHATPRTER